MTDPHSTSDGADFDLDAALDEESFTPFRFTRGGRTWELPHFRTLTPRQALALEVGDIPAVLPDDPELAELILDLPGYAGNKLIERWMRHAGVEPGEFTASTGSSRRTGRPSKPTSHATTTRTLVTSPPAD